MPNRFASFIGLLGLSFVLAGCASTQQAPATASAENQDEKVPSTTQPLIPIKADLAPGVSKESITGGGEPFPPATPRTVVKVTQMVFPAVVRLDVAQEIYSEGKRNLRRGIGSGVIIDDQGHILTNYHVAGRAAEIYVTLFNKERVPAKLIGDDHWTDLAVVQMDLEVLKKRNIPFRHAELGDSSSLVPGQDVIAIGTPFGLARTMTLGIVSNNERTFYPEKQKIDEFETGEFSNWIQMDTPIAPGNSGGPLVDLTGKIVGINTRGIAGQGLNFAIPIDTAKPVVEDILASASPESKGRVERSDLGIDFRPLQDLESFYDIDINKGALINSVDRGSPAQLADVRTQDILLEINGKPVNVRFPEEVSPARKMIADLPIGSEAKLKIKRGKEIKDIVVKTEKLQSTVGEEKEIKSWGMSVRDVSRAYANEQRLDSDKGVVVTTLNGGYPAAKAELSSGDVILAVNGKDVEDLDAFMTAYNQTTNKRETRVLLAIQRGRARQTKVLKLTYTDAPATAPATMPSSENQTSVQFGTVLSCTLLWNFEMTHTLRTGVLLAVTALAFLQPRASRAQDSPTTKPSSNGPPTIAPAFAKQLYDDVSPSLVAVQYTWEYEFGKADFVEPGVVVSADGLILLPGAELIPRLPATQLRDFKIIIPHLDKDNEEIDAELLGRDQRSEVVFVRAKEKHDWKPIKFVDELPAVGDPIASVGMLARDAGYRTYLAEAVVGAFSRGAIPTIVATGGGLANIGAPVFNTAGHAIGWVNYFPGTQQAPTQSLLHTTLGRRGEQIEALAPLIAPPHIFVATNVFALSLSDPPAPGKPQKLPWLGMPNLSGVDKDVAQVFGLENQPAVEIGDVVPSSPADKAGLKIGMKIVKLNGQPLERGDLPEELPGILGRKILRMQVGANVTFSVITEKDQPMKDFTVTLGERPIDNTWAKRAWAEDLGFGTRNLVFDDTYARKQPADLKGVIVTIIKPNSAAASAKLGREDIITQFNSQPVTDVDQFDADYKAFRKDKPKEAIVLVVMKRDASTQTIRIEPPQ